MSLLAMEVNVVAEFANGVLRELLVGHLGFLQADKIRVQAINHGLKLVQPRADTVDVE
jgi:hypothetical protein